MKSQKLKNPFPVVGYHGPEYFCDREPELNRLLLNIENGNSTTLMAIRRMGKTGLIQHLLYQLPVGWKGVYVDILPTDNLAQLLNMLSTSILKAIPERTSVGRKFWNLLKSMRPVISFNSLTNEPQISFDLKPRELQNNIIQVFQFLDKQEFRTLIALDEFQQILHYPEKNTDAWLRSIIQQLKKVVFIFSGSHQHLMSELFASPGRPFFRSTQLMTLGKIDKKTYRDFIINKFAGKKKEISNEVVDEMLDWCDVHTYYVQLLCNRVFSVAPKTVNSEFWKLQAVDLLHEQEQVFYNYRNLLTFLQWQLLTAIAMEGKVFSPTGQEFIQKHGLGSSASILRSLNALLKYELIYKAVNEKGENYYAVYDILFGQWARTKGN